MKTVAWMISTQLLYRVVLFCFAQWGWYFLDLLAYPSDLEKDILSLEQCNWKYLSHKEAISALSSHHNQYVTKICKGILQSLFACIYIHINK